MNRPDRTTTPSPPWPADASCAPVSVSTAIQLAIETTGQSGSIAILQGEEVLQAVQLTDDQRTASSLAPAIADALRWCGENKKPLHFVSVSAGPGSFTGLRIGITTAKTFCYAKRLPLVAVDSLAAIAAGVFHENDSTKTLLVGLNAYRQQTFAAKFTRPAILLETDQKAKACDLETNLVLEADDWQAFRADVDADTLCVGDAKVFRDAGNFYARESTDAIGVGLLGIRFARRGWFSDPMSLKPRYLKVSAAEEKL